MRRLTSTIVIVSSMALHACTDSPGDDAGGSTRVDAASVSSSCEETRCSTGLFFGTCDGGETGPVLACNEVTGRCRWYVGGCPIGHRASDCSPNDICCHDSGEGPWPFSNWTPSSDMASAELALDVAAMGAEIATRLQPANVAVSVDPAVLPPEVRTRVTCSAGAPIQICEDSRLRAPVVYRTEESVVVWFSSRELVNESLLLEVVTDTSGVHIGRLFVRDFTDAVRPGSPRLCAPFHREIVSGSARLSTLDDAVHGVLELILVDDHSATLEF